MRLRIRGEIDVHGYEWQMSRHDRERLRGRAGPESFGVFGANWELIIEDEHVPFYKEKMVDAIMKAIPKLKIDLKKYPPYESGYPNDE